MRLAACIAYQGAAYSGWQIQSHAASVQACVEQALSRVADECIKIHAAGRTDAGVHARAQIVHFDTEAQRPLTGWLFGGNTMLPEDISIGWVHPVDAEFHARYSAMSRHYRYFIHDSAARSALLQGRAAWSRYRLDARRMQEAGQSLCGEHDFSAFRAAQCQSKTPMRNLTRLSVSRQGDMLMVDVHANAFLHHMVRNIVGSLMEVGQGRRPLTWIAELLAARQRVRAAATAPAGGLYLWQVVYPPEFHLPAIQTDAIFPGC